MTYPAGTPVLPPPPPPAAPRQTVREIRAGDAEEVLSIASSAFAVIALVCCWVLLQLLVLGGLSEQRAQHLLYSDFRTQLAAATAPTGALDYRKKPVEPGAPVALLTIPAIDLSQVVVSGTAAGDLLHGPGHQRNTPLPGQQGISVVMGRAATYGAPFRHLADLRPGDPLTVRNAQGEVSYIVADVRRAGDPIPPAPTGTQGRLTLVTSEGAGFLGSLRPRNAVFVDAVAQKAEPTGVVPGGVLPPAEQAMARDTSAYPLLVLLLAGLVLLVLGVSAARRRFRAPLVWVVATPVAIALAWSTTDQVMRLLPNLM